MKTTLIRLAIAIAFFGVCFSASAQDRSTVLTNRSKAGIMSYLGKRIRNGQVLVGQQCSETPDVAANYKKAFQSIYDSTVKYPALLGLEYGYFDKLDLPATNRFAIDHWRAGGLVTISWHADNPFTDGYDVRWNAVKHKDSILVRNLLKGAPVSKEKTAYRTELASVAKALKSLQDAGVVVLWRPFHEANGPWFWWGANHPKSPTNIDDYRMLWQDMYETFTKEYRLKNLLWVYSPFASGGNLPGVNVMYPGGKWVDIVAVDSYPDAPEFGDYDSLASLRKLVVNGEIGPSKNGFGVFDQMAVLHVLKGKAAYFLQWHSWTGAKVSITDNLRFREMMNDPASITLDKIKR